MSAEAIKQLREHQQQLDMDGVMVGVSRQALAEALDHIATQQAEIEALKKAAHALCASIRGSGGISPDTAMATIEMMKVLEAADE